MKRLLNMNHRAIIPLYMKFKLHIFILFCIVICVGSIVGCSEYNKLLKSDDIETKYTAAVKFYHDQKYSKALTLFENIMPNLAGTEREETMLFYIGKAYYNSADYELAVETFDAYRDRFTRTAFTEEAEYLYAMSFYNQSPSSEKDQATTKQAIIAFNEYLNRYPASIQVEYIHELIEELTKKLYHKTFLNAALYYKIGKYNAAITALRSAIKEYPETPYHQEMMYIICKSWFKFAEKSLFSKQLDRYLKMSDSYFNFISTYPNSKEYGEELDKLNKKAKTFVAKYGVEAQKIDKQIKSIEDRKKIIRQSKDKLFISNDKREREELKKIIKEEKQAVKEAKKITKERRKKYKLEQKLTEDR